MQITILSILFTILPFGIVYAQDSNNQQQSVNIKLDSNGQVNYKNYGYKGKTYFYKGSQEVNPGYTDEEKNIVDNYYHSGLAQKIKDEECKKNPKACSGSDVDRNMLVETAAQMYGMVIQGALGGKVNIGTKGASSSKVAAKGSKATSSTKKVSATSKVKKGQKTKKNEKTDYCSYGAMGTEMIAMMTQKKANENIMNAPPMSAEDQQKEALYKVKRTHEERAKTSKIQVTGWGVTTGCYTAYLAYGMYSGDPQASAVSILPRLAASAFLTDYFKKIKDKQEDQADFVQSIIDKLPKTGDCNPVTQRHCFCAEPSSKADPNYIKYCLPEEFHKYQKEQAERISCLDNKMQADPNCNCVETKSCYDEKYSQMIHAIPGSNAMASQILPTYKHLSTGQLTEGDLRSAEALGQHAVRTTIKKYSKYLKTTPKHLTAKQKAMAQLLSKTMPASLAQELATARFPSSIKAKMAAFKQGITSPDNLKQNVHSNNKIKILTFGGKGLNKKITKKHKRKNSFANLFKKKKHKKNIRVLRFSERAAKQAQITHRKDTPIFDIISNRYKLSGWPIFME